MLKKLALMCIGVHYKVDLELKTLRCIQNAILEMPFAEYIYALNAYILKLYKVKTTHLKPSFS